MTLFKRILNSFKNILTASLDSMIEARQRQVEIYLSHSVDLADLERRMKEIQHHGNRKVGF